MSNIKRIGVLWAVILFFTPVAVWAADIAKIGVVDFQKILQVSEAGKAAQAKINTQGKKMEAELKKQGDAVEEIRQRLEREALVMSQEKREEKEREFRIKINDFKEMQKKYAADFKELEKRYITRIQKDVMELIEEIGKKEGFLLILERRESGIMYFPSALEITDRVIQTYNAQYSKAAPAGQGDAKAPAKGKTSQ